MKLMYHGPHDGVEVPLADGRVISGLRGESIEIPAEVATSLLEQETWKPADEAPAPKTKKAQKAEEE